MCLGAILIVEWVTVAMMYKNTKFIDEIASSVPID
ncbi:MAG: hypothetical protein ACJA0T_001634 [Colwellia sp.]|jgi:hypothetical protein